MKNPYKVLNLPQDASTAEIARAQIPALKLKKYSAKEITEAQVALRKPALRLAADFTFPLLDRRKVKPLTSDIKSREVSLDEIDLDKYNSL